ncbi:MAG TPA: VWA domain-containing protein [Vicinamibacteria bacterium]|nr:VWA domain-containing protein [Vicinamibacteria bacterium]
MIRKPFGSAGSVLGPALLFLLFGVAPDGTPQEPFHFRARVETVLLNVSVKDASGLPVKGLSQSAFTVTDEGEERAIVYFDEESEPLSVALVLDVSSSMLGGRLEEARRAAKAFIENVGAAELALVAFDDGVRVEVPWTQTPEQVLSAIDGLTARGGTALYQAIDSGLSLLSQAKNRRTALVVLSDGKEEDSEVSFSDLHRRVEVSDAPVFSVGFYTDEERRRYKSDEQYFKPPAFEVNLNPRWVLAEVARSSGGMALFPDGGSELTPAFLALAEELKHQYLIGFEPALAGRESEGFRRVSVVVRRPEHDSPIAVRTRSGYRPTVPSSE